MKTIKDKGKRKGLEGLWEVVIFDRDLPHKSNQVAKVKNIAATGTEDAKKVAIFLFTGKRPIRREELKEGERGIFADEWYNVGKKKYDCLANRTDV